MTLARNEQLKAAANFVNALALGVLGVGLLKPLLEDGASDYGEMITPTLMGIAIHLFSYYILGYLR